MVTPPVPTLVAPPLPRRVVLLPAALTWAAAACTTAVYVAAGTVLDSARAGRGPSAVTVAVIAGAVLATGLARFLASRVSLASVGRREVERRDVAVAQLFRLGVAYRTAQRSGRFVSQATDDVERAAYYESTFLGPMLASVTVPVVALVVLGAAVDPVTAAWLALAVPAIPVCVGGFQRAFRAASGRYRASARGFSAQFLDALQGLPTSTAFNGAEAKGAELADAAEQLRREVMRMLTRNQLVILVVDSAFSLAMVTAAAGLALARLAEGAITPGEALAVVLVSTVLLEPLDRIGQFFYVGMGGRAAVRGLAAMLAVEPEVVDRPGVVAPRSLRVSDRAAPVPHPARPVPPALELAHVDVSYTQGTPVLVDVSLTVPVGSRVALIGPSGSGKTTVASLVQGHLRPGSGVVRVAGHPTADVPLAWLRAQMSVVAQSTYLFTGTLADNLRLAAPEASDEMLWHALDEANLADHVRSLPDRLATVVGEHGANLSGGQAQRVAVARALLKDAPVLVLDEPTSQIDTASETALVEALARAGQGRTVLMIAHRLTTLRDADEVVVLCGGRVVEQGPPASLRAVDSSFARGPDHAHVGSGVGAR